MNIITLDSCKLWVVDSRYIPGDTSKIAYSVFDIICGFGLMNFLFLLEMSILTYFFVVMPVPINYSLWLSNYLKPAKLVIFEYNLALIYTAGLFCTELFKLSISI